MIIDERYVMCDSGGAGEDVEHLLQMCGELRGISGYWRKR